MAQIIVPTFYAPKKNSPFQKRLCELNLKDMMTNYLSETYHKAALLQPEELYCCQQSHLWKCEASGGPVVVKVWCWMTRVWVVRNG